VGATFVTAFREQPSMIDSLPAESLHTEETRDANPGGGVDDLNGAMPGPRVRPLTDLGNAERLDDRFGLLLRYCKLQGSWYHYDGQRWARDRTGIVGEYARETVRVIYREAGDISKFEDRKKALAWGIQSESASKIRAMIELAKSLPGIPIVPEDFDRDPWLLNCPNGTVDLRDGRLRPHSQDDLVTALCPTEFDPDARAPRWDQFIREVTDGDDDLAAFVMRLFGYCLTGITREQVFPILWGPGANGKSVFLDTIKAVVGPDYASDAAPELFTLSKSKQHPTELADLRGRRLVVASETEENAVLRVQLVKRLTGDARIKARFMFGDFFEFDRTHKSVLVTNSKPVISEDSEAIWRRVRLVPFTVTIPAERRDPHLLDRLRGEAPGILASLVRGCLEWQRSGLGTAKVVESASAEYRSRMVRDHTKSVVRFVEGHCEKDDAAFTLAEDLRERYESAGFPALSAKDFGLALKGLGFVPDRRHGGRGYRGVRLRAEGPHASMGDRVSIGESPREGESRCPI
jgi:putative DNA primase/helicase